MAKSAAFARIKKDVLAMTAAIPAGNVSTFKSLGDHIDVMPRHVAYILSTLQDEQRVGIPWHRIVAGCGVIKTKNTAKSRAQIELLAAEGIELDPKRRVLNFDVLFVAAAELKSGVVKQMRGKATA